MQLILMMPLRSVSYTQESFCLINIYWEKYKEKIIIMNDFTLKVSSFGFLPEFSQSTIVVPSNAGKLETYTVTE